MSPGRSIVIDVPIDKRYAPNVYLNVSFVKDSDMFEQSQILAVPARDKMLKLDIVPNKTEFKPRDVASYTIMARNEDGSPAANAEVSLGIVDEAIYSIAPETAGNIKRDFYGTSLQRSADEPRDPLHVHRLCRRETRRIWRRTNRLINSRISRTKVRSPSRRFARNSRTRRSGNPTWSRAATAKRRSTSNCRTI